MTATDPAFCMRVTQADGEVSRGFATEADVARSVTTAVRRGYRAEVTPGGGVNFFRDIPGKGCHVVAYEPLRRAGKLTATVRFDLKLIASRHISTFSPETGRIKAGYVNSIPPGAAARLRARGLVTITGVTVAVSLSARLAALAQDNRPGPWSYELSASELSAELHFPAVRRWVDVPGGTWRVNRYLGGAS